MTDIYDTIPRTVEAVRWMGPGLGTGEIMRWTGTRTDDDGEEVLNFVPLSYPDAKIWNGHMWQIVVPGMYIVKTPNGFFHCLEKDDFEGMYKKREDVEPSKQGPVAAT